MADVLSPRVILIQSREDAAREMRAIGVCEGGIDAMQGKAETVVIKVSGVAVPVAHILKQQMLSLGGEAAVHKSVLTHAIESSDVLIMGTHLQIDRLVERLSCQPFDVPSLGERIAEIMKAVRASGTRTLRARSFTLDIGKRVHVVGILNVTPDSFSDGGLYLHPAEATARALTLIEEGADVIDVGGQSSRPGSEPISEEEELKRVIPVIRALAEEWQGPISVDTYRSRVATEALAAGAAIVNDISAFSFDPGIVGVVAEAGAACVLMHIQGSPVDMQEAPRYNDLMGEIARVLSDAMKLAREAGIDDDQIVIDPGIGFGKTTQHNLAILRRLPELKVLGAPILVGPSRKSFIGNVLDLAVDDRLEGTLAAAAYAVVQGARLVRVHDVKPVVRAVRMVEACIAPPE